MTIRLTSRVRGKAVDIFNQFDQQLFLFLLPPGAKLLRFDGSEKGGEVHIKFPLGALWISRIVEDQGDHNPYFFIDEGAKLPFGLRTWRHKHSVREMGESHAQIEDHMTFSTGYALFDIIYYPLLYFAFLPRVWQYKKYFKLKA